jgi:hypothetical protein
MEGQGRESAGVTGEVHSTLRRGPSGMRVRELPQPGGGAILMRYAVSSSADLQAEYRGTLQSI